MNDRPVQAECQKRYEPPRLKVISLRPEEAVLGHCKTATTGSYNNVQGGCTPFGLCNSVGS